MVIPEESRCLRGKSPNTRQLLRAAALSAPSGEPGEQGCGGDDPARGEPEAHVRQRTRGARGAQAGPAPEREVLQLPWRQR